MATYLEYLNEAMKRARCERIENGSYFATIEKFEGLFGTGATEDEALRDLYSALDSWIDVQIKIGRKDVPDIGVDFFAKPRLLED
jgi:predicted RNase H-like HicB family nuclease